MKVLVIGALPVSLVNFRGPLLKALRANGHVLIAAANGLDSETEAKLKALGVEYCPIQIARTGINPLADLVTLLSLIRLIRHVKPDVVLGYTIKPVIYGGLAAWFCGVSKVFSMIEGLGRVFMPCESFSHRGSSIVAKALYKIGLYGSTRVFFLNPDDLNHFVKEGYVPAQKSVLLNGIGIDLDQYAQELPPAHSGCRFLMIARLLRDKGVREYVAAAVKVRARHLHADFVLAGDMDVNPSSVQQAELDAWRREGMVDYIGYLGDVRPAIRDCQVYVLPSYREGTPRTVLEAMATGRAIITTDAPGCRETVRGTRETINDKHGIVGADGWIRRGKLKIGANGILMPVRDADALAEAMEFCIRHPEEIAKMGIESRRYAEERYDVRKVNEVMLREMGLG